MTGPEPGEVNIGAYLHGLWSDISPTQTVVGSVAQMIVGLITLYGKGIVFAKTHGATDEQLAHLNDINRQVAMFQAKLALGVASDTPGAPVVAQEQTDAEHEDPAKQVNPNQQVSAPSSTAG